MKTTFHFLLALLMMISGQMMAEGFPLRASYSIENSWPTGYQVIVTLKNESNTPTKNWRATFSLQKNQKISTFWNGEYKTSGQSIVVTNPSWTGGGVIESGASTSFGMIIQNPRGFKPGLSNLVATGDVMPGQSSIPEAPVLSVLKDEVTPNNYTLSWSRVGEANRYILQQDTTSSFSNPKVVAEGTALLKSFNNQPKGTYYYRVLASNGAGTSKPSNVQKVVVGSSSGSSQHLPGKQPFVEGYWESWNSRDPVRDIVQMKANIVDISFGTFTKTAPHTFVISGIETNEQAILSLVTAAHSADKKVKIAIGGVSYPIEPMLKTVEDAHGMAHAVASYVKKFDLDGVDFDIEDYPQAELQVALLQQTRHLLGSNFLISYTPKSPASTTEPYAQVIKKGHSHFDYLSIMAYDYGPGYSYQTDVKNLLEMGVPASKIVVGLMPGVDDVGTKTNVTDVITAAKFVVDNKLAGIMLWSLNRDLSNQTGLGPNAATNAAWSVFHP